MPTPLLLTREQILAHRRRVNGLDARLPGTKRSRAAAAHAGLQDSMPRAAVLSLHARVAGIAPDDWAAPGLVQVWGPRFSAFVVTEEDAAVFTVGRMPDDAAGIRRAEEAADRLERVLAGRRIPYGRAGREAGVSPNSFRYGTTTGRIRIHWDGARQPEVWMVDAPRITVAAARAELARRHLRVFGPATPDTFAQWAGIKPKRARAILDELADETLTVRTPMGDRLILADDEASFRGASDEPAPARLLPSGDAYTLHWGPDRDLMVPDPGRRDRVWTPRVWPGSLLVGGGIAGTWSRTHHKVRVTPWRRLTTGERAAVEEEALSLPLPGDHDRIAITWG